jgi:zinc protease
VQLGATPARDYSSLLMTAAKGTIAAGFDLMADAVLNPAFDPKEVDRVRKIRIGELVQLKEDPAGVSDIVTLLALNGKESPYAYPALGTEASLKALTTDDLKAFWRAQVHPGNAALVVSGDMTKDELQPVLEKSFGSWSGEPAPPITITDAPVTGRLVIVDAPGAPQTQLRVALPGPMRSTPEYESLLVMNDILGGAFSSRLNLNLREKHGYTYGAYMAVRALAHDGWLVAGTGALRQATAPAVREMVREIGQMGDQPIRPEEIMLVKSTLVRALPSWFETTSSTVGMLSDIPAYNLGLNYYQEYVKKVEAVTEQDIRSVAKKYLLPEKMLIVAVGDRKTIEGGLRALKLGEVEIRDADGNLK